MRSSRYQCRSVFAFLLPILPLPYTCIRFCATILLMACLAAQLPTWALIASSYSRPFTIANRRPAGDAIERHFILCCKALLYATLV